MSLFSHRLEIHIFWKTVRCGDNIFLLGIYIHRYFTVKNINLNKIYNKIINIYRYDINYCIQLISKYTDLKFT